MSWLQKIAQISISLGDYPQKLRKYLEELLTTYSDFTPQEFEEYYNQILSESNVNVQKIQNIVQKAIGSIGEWNGSPVVIKSDLPPEESHLRGPDYTKPIEDAYITVVGPTEWGGELGFSFFNSEEGIIIDDVLEAGDADFFSDANTTATSDYFNLVRELRNPGSSSKGKNLTLYTARPTKDRELYMNATQVPANLFLTNSFDRASGIASDLGRNEVRDVWRVRINSKYLIQTLDGHVKDYQVTSEAPVISMELVSPGQ